tara:strand:- start:139 stop:999 length:861 start_codon:yes stop_codon:yes gene_type:complete
MGNIFFLLLKLKLINKDNVLFIIFSRLYYITGLSIFNKYSTINTPKFKSLPLHFTYFEKVYGIIKSNSDNRQINFNKKNILEIGGGNFWGLMPFFAKYNSKTVTNIDIILDNQIINSNFVWRKYINKISSYVSIDKINKLKFHNYEATIENLKTDLKFDVVVSVSCLEHIIDINSFFKNIKKFTNKNSNHIHIVNFTNHISKKEPFRYIYEHDKSSYLKKFKTKINLLRLSDFEKTLELYDFTYKSIILSKAPIKEKKINNFWKENYDLETLSISTAIIIINGYRS